jgi:hypothetical protein
MYHLNYRRKENGLFIFDFVFSLYTCVYCIPMHRRTHRVGEEKDAWFHEGSSVDR